MHCDLEIATIFIREYFYRKGKCSLEAQSTAVNALIFCQFFFSQTASFEH